MDAAITVAGWLVFAVGCWFALGWAWSVRKAHELQKATVVMALLFVLAVISIPVFGLSPFHLLWMFPASFIAGTLSLVFPFSLLTYPGLVYWRLLKIGR